MATQNPALPMPPQPVPEALRADRWQFAALPAGELWDFATSHPIPFQSLAPTGLGMQASPLALGLASTLLIPGVIFEGGRKSRLLAQWIQEQNPLGLEYVPGELQGLILYSRSKTDKSNTEQTGQQRWIMATFQDPEVGQAGATYQQRLSQSNGFHFLLVQPDDSGQTYTGIWLLQRPVSASGC